MPNFGTRWQVIESKPIGKGGQSHAYLVRDAEGGGRYVSKLFNGPSDPRRRARLEREIVTCREFDHPNVVRFIDAGRTENIGYPFLVVPYYEHGSLEDFKVSLSDDPVEILSFFAKICDGVAHVHEKGIVHRDIKPAHIFVAVDRQPVVGDFGISFRAQDERITGPLQVVAPRWFGAPELRNGYLENPTSSADVYSLGKLLCWLFTRKVYDREEQDYGRPDRTLAGVLKESVPAYSFVDRLVDAAVQYDPEKRKIPGAESFAGAVRDTIARIEAGGHVLDLRLPQRCVFSGLGNYRPAHADNSLVGPTHAGRARIPEISERQIPENPGYPEQSRYAAMRAAARNVLGIAGAASSGWGIPLVLICAIFSTSVGIWRMGSESTGYRD